VIGVPGRRGVAALLAAGALTLAASRFGSDSGDAISTAGASSHAGAAVTAATGSDPALAPAVPGRRDRPAVEIDARQRRLTGVRIVSATREPLGESIRAVGVVRYDESRLSDVNLRTDAWILDVHAKYTGQVVRKGQPLLTFYSPEVLAAAKEYLVALSTREQPWQSQTPDARQRADDLVASLRQRLTLLGLDDEQVRRVEAQRRPGAVWDGPLELTHVVFRSPFSGVVIDRRAVTGAFIEAGQTLYTIADLSIVWIEADVYEHELSLVKIGAPAVVTLDAYPGERFDARTQFLHPYLDERTRTNKVRYQLDNRGGRLKPGMLASVEIAVASDGGITVPVDAVLDSGRDQYAFVAVGGGYFQPRRVIVGRRSAARAQILDGVAEGERLAAGAAFLLDSESQLLGSLNVDQPEEAVADDATTRDELSIELRTDPDPPRAGATAIEVTVGEDDRQAVEDATVSVLLFMPAMPSMDMPAMKSTAELSHVGGGTYRGTADVLMNGRWEVTVTVVRGGRTSTYRSVINAR
jgi:RND family efflux transporter MFP subunit